MRDPRSAAVACLLGVKLSLGVVLGVTLLATAACAPPRGSAPPPVPPLVVRPPSVEGRAKFDAALAVFLEHDHAHNWTPSACAAVAALFDEASARGSLPQATFNAGLTHQRCGDDAKARARFEKVVAEDPHLYAAQAKLALFRFKETGDADAAIAALERAVAAGKFSDVATLVDLAAMQIARDGSVGGASCKDDMDCAKLNLHRALALDDAYMPAHNELALYYLQLARKRSGSAKRGGVARQVVTPTGAHKRGDVQQLELAALVCSQAIAKDPRYAPIHNTAGLIQSELGRVNSAVAAFGKAAELDPKFFEAQMNYAALNLGFRGFEQAQTAYRRALAVRPNDYDAHIGLAVALRGPIAEEADERAHQEKLAAVDAALAAAKRIDPSRPDAFYNEGIFFHELKSKAGTPAESRAALESAEKSFRLFLDKAKGQAEYAGAVERAHARLEDIAATKTFILMPTPPAAAGSTTTPAPTP